MVKFKNYIPVVLATIATIMYAIPFIERLDYLFSLHGIVYLFEILAYILIIVALVPRIKEKIKLILALIATAILVIGFIIIAIDSYFDFQLVVVITLLVLFIISKYKTISNLALFIKTIIFIITITTTSLWVFEEVLNAVHFSITYLFYAFSTFIPLAIFLSLFFNLPKNEKSVNRKILFFNLFYLSIFLIRTLVYLLQSYSYIFYTIFRIINDNLIILGLILIVSLIIVLIKNKTLSIISIIILTFVTFLLFNYPPSMFYMNILNILSILGLIILIGLNKDTSVKYSSTSGNIPNDEYLKTSVGMSIALSLLTFGIYYLVWMYRIMKTILTNILKENKSPVGELLLFIFIPFYNIYWFYSKERALIKYKQEKNKYAKDNSTLYIVLAIFGFGLIATAIMQDDINKLFLEENLETNDEDVEIIPTFDIKQRLLKLEEIYKDGLISIDDYNKKKEEILTSL